SLAMKGRGLLGGRCHDSKSLPRQADVKWKMSNGKCERERFFIPLPFTIFHLPSRHTTRAAIIVTSSVRGEIPTNLRSSHRTFCATVSAVAPPLEKASTRRFLPKRSLLKFAASVT